MPQKTNGETDIDDFRITIIGLGLIGGSMAMALQGYRNATITGVDINPKTRDAALKSGAVQFVYEHVEDAVKDADLIIQCVYPHHIIDFMRKHRGGIKHGAIVTDVCGTKTHLYEAIEPLLHETIEYVGIHPMAGKEVDGFKNAESTLFRDTGFLITPLSTTKQETVELMKELGHYIGATKIAVANPQLHDDIIGYTSDLMHISATALCMHFHPDMSGAFTAGAFRDCTRIANINPDLWTELLLTNADKTLPHLKEYIGYLNKMQSAMEQHDDEAMHELLALALKNKLEMLKRA